MTSALILAGAIGLAAAAAGWRAGEPVHLHRRHRRTVAAMAEPTRTGSLTERYTETDPPPVDVPGSAFGTTDRSTATGRAAP